MLCNGTIYTYKLSKFKKVRLAQLYKFMYSNNDFPIGNIYIPICITILSQQSGFSKGGFNVICFFPGTEQKVAQSKRNKNEHFF